MGEKKWRYCQIGVRFLTEKAKGPSQQYETENNQVELQKAMTIGQFAIEDGMATDQAFAALRRYFLKENPQFTEKDFSLEMFNPGGYVRPCEAKDICFITPGGCTLGLPS
jgi:hypothetical protein